MSFYVSYNVVVEYCSGSMRLDKTDVCRSLNTPGQLRSSVITNYFRMLRDALMCQDKMQLLKQQQLQPKKPRERGPAVRAMRSIQAESAATASSPPSPWSCIRWEAEKQQKLAGDRRRRPFDRSLHNYLVTAFKRFLKNSTRKSIDSSETRLVSIFFCLKKILVRVDRQMMTKHLDLMMTVICAQDSYARTLMKTECTKRLRRSRHDTARKIQMRNPGFLIEDARHGYIQYISTSISI
ncbi:unnamed protein product [Trichogramma brassicae]|uniref:Uncharacterized protein n=1 Tax=Trichogramma brassicae TaxID=86971 RepID=A0A6H5IV11_9HYME|nr:unnamed protein product [Trichogramma brassicae]